ncbi:bifunctional 2-polyprenyl-6-hydroxyphenol methylase/3-demethylubiquinol 3-O-methyltransferase UbiG [Vibrio gazogenes]|uniref:Methyltransferase domain-containing protein n=1 Tax=Vibrio gazogenes DSM 21264 = NBRC 103151 TaxID=1123492 RepID=A0A1M4XYJ7_VIBGA|nr:class I SAM-dependent methyltransferase [Vibrio gazogenes]USP12842.1 class I SAM-dependent methyltransferase [Vibrio gazogenes]SHE98322.1 Methyltransferase domain-containing protein [Vibrio gazogenes DSM 21264] [Vibrio gazogenes DSM 21264 = NBRC 103151]SJN58830.1 bifunctional 3-demethylubiquinone-9 3-methyltransferase/ 2-octaprenyl-6-hydroxy phenol methylase [Vibrio gazogenes]
MTNEKYIEQNRYFNYRNVEPTLYDNVVLPAWIKSEIDDHNANILDYGCGFGQLMQALLNEKYMNVFGLDIEKSAISHCHSKNLNVMELDLNELHNPFNIKFDVIIFSHVIEHMPKEKIIKKLEFIKNTFLSENGKFLIAVPNAQANTDAYWAYEDWTHTTLFTSGSIYYVLKAAGFNNVEFLDIDCTLGIRSKLKKLIVKFLLKIYICKKIFWNKVTNSPYHKPSPQIFSYEIKCKAY